jgi:predicted dienelactone hydrolase
MRPFEIALLAGNLVTFLLLVIPRARATRWPFYAGAASALVVLVQIVAEGTRWQMFLAYAVTALLLGVSALLALWPHLAERRHSLGQRIVIGSAIALTAAIMAISALLPWAVPMFEFPPPSGPYPIGTATYHWVDESRADFGDPTARRELMVQLWYPAASSAVGEHDTYIQDDMHFGTLPGTPFPGFFSNHLNDVRTNAVKSAPAAQDGGSFPVLIFSPGAEGFRQHNTFEVEDLVSHGYIVAAIDHPRAAREVVFPDGRRVEFDPRVIDVPRFLTDPDFADPVFDYLGEDVSFALDRIVALNAADPTRILTGRIDANHVGMFGVSLGGVVAAEACRIDPRIGACLIEDVFAPQDVVASGLAQPTMWLSRDPDSMRLEGWPEWEIDLHQSTMMATFEGVRSDRYIVRIPGMFHLNYTDFPYTIATPIARQLGIIGPIDWRRGHTIVNAYTLAFFDRYLKREPQPLLDGKSAQFPEIQLETRKSSASSSSASVSPHARG